MNFILDNSSSSSSSSDDDEDDLIMNHFRLQQNIICRIISNNNIIISHLLDKQNRQDSSSDSDSECSSAPKLGRRERGKRERGKAQMAAQTLCTNSSLSIPDNKNAPSISPHKSAGNAVSFPPLRARRKVSVQCSENQTQILRTCKYCKTQFDPLLNHPRACRFHSAHFGGETKRKFESVHSGGTMDTPDSGKVYQYWHCCGSEDAFDPGCTAAPHSSYDD